MKTISIFFPRSTRICSELSWTAGGLLAGLLRYVFFDKYRLYVDLYHRAVNAYSDSDGRIHTGIYTYRIQQTTMKTTKRRRALTILEKQMICQKMQKPEHTMEKLSDFGNTFLMINVSRYFCKVICSRG